MIGPHLQETTNYHAQPDATPVTKQDVQNDLIPPAFSKIRQKVHEEELENTAKRFWVRNNAELIQIQFLSTNSKVSFSVHVILQGHEPQPL